MTDKLEFPADQWETMKGLVERDGPVALIRFVEGFEPASRRKLYEFGHRALSGRDWVGKNLDVLVTFVRAGIESALAQAAGESSSQRADELKDAANRQAFNLAADLAECWPGDELPRERRHFQTGLEMARQAIAWRTELGKGPLPLALAWWAHGMHLLSLRDPSSIRAAISSFEHALDHARQVAAGKQVPVDVHPDTDFQVLLNAGYLEIARQLAGESTPGGPDVLAAFRARVEKGGEDRDDFQFGLDQLDKVGQLFSSASSPRG